MARCVDRAAATVDGVQAGDFANRHDSPARGDLRAFGMHDDRPLGTMNRLKRAPKRGHDGTGAA